MKRADTVGTWVRVPLVHSKAKTKEVPEDQRERDQGEIGMEGGLSDGRF